MTGQLVMPPAVTAKKFWPRIADAYVELGQAVADVEVVDGDVTLSWTGGISPFVVEWGDGEHDDQVSSPAHHTYHVDDDFTITLRDAVGQVSTTGVTIIGSVPV